jgi:predicted amidohydrolase YtcJ
LPDLSRRSFVAALAGGAAALSPSLRGAATMGSFLAAPRADDADLILLNGRIITVDPNDSVAQAVAVSQGRITAVGDTASIRALAGAGTRVIDLNGKCVTPGLVDSHFHVIYYGQQFRPGWLDIRFPKARTKADLLRLVEARAKDTPKGQWVVGNQGFSLSVGGVPSLAELDAVTPDHPVYLKDRSGQFALVNTLALRQAGIACDTPDPLNAKIGRDAASGEPNGLLFHYPAEQMVQRRIPGYGTRTEADAREGQRRALAAGYTSAQDVIVMMQEDIDEYRALARAGGLQMRLYLMRYLASEQQAQAVLPLVDRFKDEWLTFGGWKLAVDGGPSAGTCLMYDRSLPMANRSYPFFEQGTLDRIVLQAHNTGLQVAFHAMGDRAIDMAINAVEAALNASPRENHRHRIEHLVFPSRQALERIKRLGIVVSTSPQWISFFSEALRQASDDATMEGFFPLRTMLDMGIPVAFGCDVPATIMVEPRWAFIGAVTRASLRGGGAATPEQRIGIHDALRMHTLGSAYAAFEEDIKGSIEPGKLADLVVWSHDLYAAMPRELAELQPVTTMVGGNVVYE